MGKSTGRQWLREVEGRAQDLVCIPESDLVTGQKERNAPAKDRKGPLGTTSFISKVILRQLAVDFHCPPNKVGPFLPYGCNPPRLYGTQVDAQFLGRAVWLFMV